MKSLKKVIKQKCKFIGNSWLPYELYEIDADFNPRSDFVLFRTHSSVKVSNVCILLQEMIPLYVYILSCLKYHGQPRFFSSISNMKLVFFYSEAELNLLAPFSCHSSSCTIEKMKSSIADIRSRGHYTAFSDCFRIDLVIKVYDGDDDDNDDDDNDDDNDKENKPLTTNEVKTFKTDDCVICLDNKPNVLFCNCGHICVCKK